ALEHARPAGRRPRSRQRSRPRPTRPNGSSSTCFLHANVDHSEKGSSTPYSDNAKATGPISADGSDRPSENAGRISPDVAGRHGGLSPRAVKPQLMQPWNAVGRTPKRLA